MEGGRWWSLLKKIEPCEYNESKTNPKVSKVGFICTDHLHCLACISDLFVILLFCSNLYIDIFTHLSFLKMGRVKKNKSHVFYQKKNSLFAMLIFKDSYFKPWEQLKENSYSMRAQGELWHENKLVLCKREQMKNEQDEAQFEIVRKNPNPNPKWRKHVQTHAQITKHKP